tara:strand:+ start:160 stop:687 length:528 start_codon:yes stop_codon:yes gene_type:complete
MKINEVLIVPKESKDTGSSATISSAIKEDQTQDVVPQDIVSQNELALEVDSIETHPDHSAIAEGVSQILRRTKGKAPKQGFRCSSGPRKGRIVAKPSTCFQKTDPVRSAKIRKKRQQKAKIAGKKLAQTKRSGAGSLRLKGTQIKRTKGSQPRHGKSSRSGSRPLMKSKVIKRRK